ncbi:MAG: GGDEF domain-containing protein [Clostridiales bacterium]|nr:GGDEF domain-containing protein [Clostridiales bacterium]
MLDRVKRYLFYGDTDADSYNLIKDRIEDSNMAMALVFSSVATVLISIMLVLSYTVETFAASRKVFVFGIVFSVIQVGVALAARKVRWLSYVSVYMAISVFLIYGIAIGTITRPEEQTVTFMVMLVLVPLIFLDRPIRMACALLVYVIAFIVLAVKNKTGAVLSADVSDAIIFGVLSIASETIIYRTKIQRYVFEMRLQIISQTDQLTGLNNRNFYEYKLGTYKGSFRNSLGCIYMDINGLHELNNSKGHKAGDDMLCYIADCFREVFGTENTFRIGGDEYVAFVLDIPLKEIEKKIATLKKNIEKAGYHAAIGLEYTEDTNVDINALITDSEVMMYKNKVEYYRTHDRRERRG